MSDLPIDLRNILTYDPTTGLISYNGIIIHMSEDYFCYININSTRIKLKYNSLVWYLVHGIKPTNQEKIHHKDLNPRNTRLDNLMLMSNTVYFRIKEYIYNLSGGLKLYQHPKDSYSLILEYKCKGRKKRETISDSSLAKKTMFKLQYNMLKYLDKYIVTN